MDKLIYVFVIILSVTVLTWSSPAKQCPGENFDDLQNRIHVDPCGKTKCRLPKERNTTVTFRFKPTQDVKNLINDVSANIGGLILPFIGVNGVEGCGNVHHADDGTPAPCPLKANTEYIYKNIFYVEPLFPELSNTPVHWSLKDGDFTVICFDIQIAIVKKKNKMT